MTDHSYFEQLCSNYMDGTLTDDERHVLDQHLESCQACAALLRDYQQMRRLMSCEEPLPEGLHEQLMDQIVNQARTELISTAKPVHRLPVFTMVAAAAVVVLVALSGGFGAMFGNMQRVDNAQGAVSSTASSDAAAAMPQIAEYTRIQPQTGESAPASPSAEAETPAAPVPSQSRTSPQTPPQSEAAQPAAATPPQNTAQLPETAPSATSASLLPDQAAGLPEGEQIAPRVGAPSSEQTDNSIPALSMQPPLTEREVPSSLYGMRIVSCYLAKKGEDGKTYTLPSGTELVANEGGYSYFTVPNNMLLLEEAFNNMEAAGYSIGERQNGQLVLDAQAEAFLLIVQD